MEVFNRKFSNSVTGILSGFDRLVLRGHLRSISHKMGVVGLLLAKGIKFVDFADYVERQTRLLTAASLAAAVELGRPVRYLASSQISKEETARAIARADAVAEGLICVLKCIEPCQSFELVRNREKKKATIEPRRRKCTFLYHYWMDPQFGLMSGRIQTWLPYSIQVCLNGREWLARALDAAGIAYRKQDNCITWVEDLAAAQALFDRQLATDWPAMLEAVARRLNPAHEAMLGRRHAYYWSVYQSEWASDVLFDSAATVARLFPRLTRGAIDAFGAQHVMRYLRDAELNPRYEGRVVSDLRRRQEGARIKHWAGDNSIKMYDKAATVLRVETTINAAEDFKSYRTKEGDPDGAKQWRAMRRGVADLARRAEVSQSANERYLDAIARLDTDQRLGELAAAVCRRTRWKGQCVRALQPWSDEDTALLAAVGRGEWTINGFRNSDVRGLLEPAAARGDKRAAARVTRQLRLLRAHGLIQKISHTHRYRLTEKGRVFITAFKQIEEIPVHQLTKAAA